MKLEIGTRVRLSEDLIQWNLDNDSYDSYCRNGKMDAQEKYDSMAEVNLLMALSEDEYPGVIESLSHFTGTCWIHFDNGHGEWVEFKYLIAEPPAALTTEEINQKEFNEIKNIIHHPNSWQALERLIKILVEQGILSSKQVKLSLGL